MLTLYEYVFLYFLLQGQVPGLNIYSTQGGGLNQKQSINVRGIGTIGEGSTGSALILIDGMEGDIYSINPQDIESVSVLKDAAASSIYGSRAPFGVILVTTKKGKAGKAQVNYNNSFRISSPINMPSSLDSHIIRATHSGILTSVNSTAAFATVSPLTQRSPTPHTSVCSLSFGLYLSPVKFSAQRRSTSELLRTL